MTTVIVTQQQVRRFLIRAVLIVIGSGLLGLALGFWLVSD